MELSVWFPGKKKVDVAVGSFVVHTDQSFGHGGDGSAPEPFDLFLASIGACAGLYVLGFCQSRGIPTDRIRIEQKADLAKGTLSKVSLAIHVPPGFPEKYLQALVTAASGCAVKRAMDSKPEITVQAIQAAEQARA
jgi:ribosomal protein S12 methylthiotransferase accessory factor